MSLRQRIERLDQRHRSRSGGRCPCGETDVWTGWLPVVLARVERAGVDAADQEHQAQPPRCRRCGGAVHRPTVAEVQALVAKIERQESTDSATDAALSGFQLLR